MDESIRANILNRETLSNIDLVFGELIREDMHINTQASWIRPTQLTWLYVHQKVLINHILRAQFKSLDHNVLSAKSMAILRHTARKETCVITVRSLAI